MEEGLWVTDEQTPPPLTKALPSHEPPIGVMIAPGLQGDLKD
jgi:hypothetical protein